MSGVRVLVATEPENLDREFLRLLPQLVVCSRLTRLVEHNAPSWVELYPGGVSCAVVGRLGGRRHTLASMDSATLLSILDNAKQAYVDSRTTS